MRIAFHTLGCKVNQYETEAMKEQWKREGDTIVPENAEADVYIVNTCTVTGTADRKSRQYIRRMKGKCPSALVAVTGCYAQIEYEAICNMPEVDIVVGNGLKSHIRDIVLAKLRGEVSDRMSDTLTDEVSDTPSITPSDTPSDTHSDTICKVLRRDELTHYEDMGLVESSESEMSRAYVKLQEGCDRFCSYCLIPYARGPVRSRPMDELLEEAEILISKGYREIILTGINTALYGTEAGYAFERRQSEEGLTALEVVLSRLNSIDADFRIRLSSLEPTVVDREHVERIIKYDKLCHHLHLSLQAGSFAVLKAMNRHYTAEEYRDIVRAVRNFDPLYGITTDIIVGFPGETEEDVAETLRLIDECEFGRVHVFRYSPRPGTAGAALPDAVSETAKAHRAALVAEAADEAAKLFALKNFGQIHTVLIERAEKGYMTGYTENYIKVYIEAPEGKLSVGSFCRVKLAEIYEDGCRAVLHKDIRQDFRQDFRQEI